MEFQNRNHLMREFYERIPVFGLQNTLGERRLVARLKGFGGKLLTVKGILFAAAALYLVIYFFVYVTATANAWEVFVGLTASILVFVIPIYACFNALFVGAMALSEPVSLNHAQDWIQAGIAPRGIVKQLIGVSLFRHLPAILIYAALFVGLFDFVSTKSWYYQGNRNAFQLPALAISIIAIQVYLVFASSFIGLVARSLTGRLFAAFGYFIVHSVGPLIVIIIVEMTRLNMSQYSGDFGEFYTHLIVSTNVIGSIIYTLTLDETGGFEISPVYGFMISIAFLAAMSYCWFIWSVRLFKRKVMI